MARVTYLGCRAYVSRPREACPVALRKGLMISEGYMRRSAERWAYSREKVPLLTPMNLNV
jgi:hypothetical protein